MASVDAAYPTGTNLILLLMDPIHIASILQQFEKLPFVNTVELNLQRSIELKGGNSPTIARAASIGQQIALNITISDCCRVAVLTSRV